jgi:hypothetical protein
METVAVDFLFISGLWALFSPLLVSALKNVGGSWPTGAKQALAIVMALVGSVVAYGMSAGWASIDLADWAGFWQPLTIGVAAIFGTQYASYMAIWNDTKVMAVAEGLGTSGK